MGYRREDLAKILGEAVLNEIDKLEMEFIWKNKGEKDAKDGSSDVARD